MSISDLAGRDVALLGAGREALSVRRALRALDADCRLALYAEADPGEAVTAELARAGDRLVVGPFDAEALSRHDVLVRSPGVSPYRPELQAALAAGVRVTTASNLWFADNPEAPVIAVTGTKGKSTTTALTAHLLNAAGVRAIACGNIGQPLLDVDPSGVDWWVVELSSYQLCDLVARPRVGGITNLSPEHLDWHGGWERYRADKLRLAGLVGDGPLAANGGDQVLREALGSRPGTLWFNDARGWHLDGDRLRHPERPVVLDELAGAPGPHNLLNLAAALTLAAAAGHLPPDLPAALAGFRGLPHRLHTIGESGGLRFVDDSLATTPVATLAALRALRGQPVTVLVGGKDRGLDWAGHAGAIAALAPHALVALPDNGPHILSVLGAHGLAPTGGMHEAADMTAAVALARRVTPSGGVVLLSPGAPSFPHYADYRARGEAFARQAGLLKEINETAGQG